MKRLMLLASLLLLFIGCSSKIEPNINEPKFEVNKKLYPFKSNYMTLENGAKIHYVDEGEGDVLLLLHGNPTWSFLYRKMIEELKGDFRVIAPDYAGFGLSYASKDFSYKADAQAKLMNEFLTKMDLKDVTIMVQDWGGPIGFNIAITQPERVKAFIIGNTWAWELERAGHKAFSTLFGGYVGQFIS
jgi:haloalkane dehalogenase